LKELVVELYLIRHAEAAPLGEGGITLDEDRPLTDSGKHQATQLADGLKRFGVALDLVLASPLVRARQTAEGMLENWGAPPPALQVLEELAPGTKRRKLAKRLRLHANAVAPQSPDRGAQGSPSAKARIALVGHDPDLARFAGWVIGSRKCRLDLAKAGVAYVHCENGVDKASGVLKWLATPDWLELKT
jgi:phosphohistidine phosphatase